ncbi:HAMP domain-containing histidine kinase, partial [Pseudanabaenaceae cyanobacterium LEGE 13415]|nr:HAMP domain-containing histidine kinase [Pseudanabaenaceae cyanobacterium LEGE 13415]
MTLRLRFFLSHLLILVSSLTLAGVVAHSYKAQQFSSRLARMERAQQSAPSPGSSAIQNCFSETLDLFYTVNDQGTLSALFLSFFTVGGLSVYLTRSILKPLKKIEYAARQFSAGDLDVRILPSNIPEIRRLELTLNSVADRLQGVEERRQELVGDLAHEMGTPLTVIRGYLELLETSDKFELTPDVTRQLHEEAERMTRLLADLNTLSKIEAGSLPLRLESFSPRPVIEQVIANFQATGWNNACGLSFTGAENLPQIFADRDRFNQILTNLIRNALEYTPEGSVTVKAWAERERFWVTIQDTGIGIAAKDLPFVFQRFWRSERSRS